ncbi:hypothetical protein NM208_g101 [Fusarium decemcellulare]|uniref:Uncharacterized protein n=1 Tax=Fusarium decemcellulare TaxID=57161 RepID=A0ACC1T0X3_9HYPO|nr:hypothetical protein NM208_g101 [Fusarium decemcellulare]
MANKQTITDLARRLIQDGPRKTLPTSRRVRAIHNNTFIVDTTKSIYVWEHDYYPTLYVPRAHLKNCQLNDKQEIGGQGKGKAAVAELVVPSPHGGGEATVDGVLRFDDDESLGPLAGNVRINFNSISQWLEEDVPIFVHPKDPFKRVDILASQRHIQVKVQGKTVADAASSMHLFETGLPTRYYLPLASVDPAVLRKSDLITRCPYKGEAEYYHVVVDGEEISNIVWYYRLPTHESSAIAGLVCFYNEKVDIIIDGELQSRPSTHFA